MWGDIVIAFLLAFITSFVATPYTIRLAKKIGAVDVPIEERKIHTKTVPRLGGLAVIAGFVVSIIYLFIVMSLENTINLVRTRKLLYETNRLFLGAFSISCSLFYR